MEDLKDNMLSFLELFSADATRYKDEGFDIYRKNLLKNLRRIQTTNNSFLRKYYIILYKWLCHLHGLEIPYETRIGKGLYLGHVYNITINPGAIIGENCNIHKGVVIGSNTRGVPKIGDSVFVGINAAVIGDITIGDDVLIAPNSFVNINIPSHSIVFGNPCIIKKKDNATKCYINNKA